MKNLEMEIRLCSYSDCTKQMEGRSDKIYCSDQCRNRAGRDRLKNEKWNAPKYYNKIQTILENNHKILKAALDEKGESSIVTYFYLRDKGFHFDFNTRLLATSKGIYRFCFDHGWLELENGRILIVYNEKMTFI